ncbi:peptide-methionine (S)-S-oxide reductase MsrA [Candidatus Wolfebacteria bacterium]|nr:peptide-methionine (S)-S-oxide reductase MsrA [Candidatus Wolfebacteria bacterium]
MNKKAYFAGGCFWGIEDLFKKIDGVIDTETGYTGGSNENPTYQNHEGHAEALEVTYDTDKVSYKTLLDWFFRIHNPTTLNQQGNDKGTSYRSAIFYQDAEERGEASSFIDIVDESEKWPNPVVTTLEEFSTFWAAESEHQDYLQNNTGGYTCHAVYFDSYIK